MLRVTEYPQIDTLWLEYPNMGGASPEIPVKIDTVDYLYYKERSGFS